MEYSREQIKEKFVSLFSDSFREDWMDDDDFDFMLSNCVTSVGGWDRILEDIQQGVVNGYGVEFQFDLVKKAFTESGPKQRDR